MVVNRIVPNNGMKDNCIVTKKPKGLCDMVFNRIAPNNVMKDHLTILSKCTQVLA